MSEVKKYNEIQESQTTNPSPSKEDILETSKNIDKSHQIGKKAEKIKQSEQVEADKYIEEALEDTTNSPNKEQYINGKSIDSSSKITLINSQISQLQAKINLIEQKNDLSDKDYDVLDSLGTKLDKLNADKLVIKQGQGKQLDKDKAISKEKNEKANETIRRKKDEIKKAFKSISPNNNQKKQIEKLLNEDKLDEIISLLKNPWALESIAKDLGWVKNPDWTVNQKYLKFKNTMINVEPSLKASFDRVEMNSLADYTKIKMWTDSLANVVSENGVWKKTEDGTTIEVSDKEWRKISGKWNLKVNSELDPIYEEKMQDEHNKNKVELKPINEALGFISSILDYLEKAKNSWVEFSKAKNTIQSQNPEIYTELWLDFMQSYDSLLRAIKSKKQDIEKESEDIINKHSEKMDLLVSQNKKEALEKDRAIKEMMKFFDEIAFSILGQSKLKQIIANVNVSPWKYNFQNKIDLESWNIGFNKDFWDKGLSATEKQAFIQFFNKMLWENIVDENIALGTTTLSLEAKSKIQKLNNRTVWYFMENLNKENR